ncbi:MAG: hypothetical protein V7676_17510 [Parasphingorhabdus sp.]|uniref:hypothetical protein n=1 Tax=Parasphingorhabdus sp. TaxID=2709688 RepID=UPI003003910E
MDQSERLQLGRKQSFRSLCVLCPLVGPAAQNRTVGNRPNCRRSEMRPIVVIPKADAGSWKLSLPEVDAVAP